MICVKCGQEFNEGSDFRIKCGYKVKDTAPGKKFIKITGILLVVFGAIGIISSISSATMSSTLGDFGVSMTSIVLGVISALFGIALGVLGILYCKNIEKAKLLQYCVFAYIAYYFINLIIGTIISSNMLTAQGLPVFAGLALGLVSGLIGLIIPICFLIGAQKNLKAKGV